MKASKRVVYSTDAGRHCPGCSRPIAQCICKSKQFSKTGDGIVRLHRQSKGRGGKPVTLIKGLDLPADELNKLCKELKSKCGVGGSCMNNEILIQGDIRERLAELLGNKGYTVKISGG